MLEWEPLFERFLENDVPVLMEFSTLAEAKAARKIYYRIREYYQQDEEWLKKYGSVLDNRKAIIEGTALIFELHSLEYLEALRKAVAR